MDDPQQGDEMNAALLPELAVEQQLLADLEDVLRDGETVADFVVEAVRRSVAQRRVEADFHARGEAAWHEYERTGISRPAGEVLDELQAMTERRRKELGL